MKFASQHVPLMRYRHIHADYYAGIDAMIRCLAAGHCHEDDILTTGTLKFSGMADAAGIAGQHHFQQDSGIIAGTAFFIVFESCFKAGKVDLIVHKVVYRKLIAKNTAIKRKVKTFNIARLRLAVRFPKNRVPVDLEDSPAP